MARAVTVCTLVLVLLLLPASAASAAKPPKPWATVNVCDTAKHPHAIGVRASVPGRKGQRALVQFRVQWKDPADGLWHNVVVDGGESRKVSLGRFTGVTQTGWIFRFEPPASGPGQLLRGVVRFEWRRGGRVVDSLSRSTSAGHRSTAGSDPKGYSAATCRLGGD